VSIPEPTVERLAAVYTIEQLSHRYAIAVDSRDLDLISTLFSPDSKWGDLGQGPEAVRAFFRRAWSGFGISVHRICNITIDFQDDTHAIGTVYLDGDHQEHDGTWSRISLTYWDRYERRDDGWCFRSRQTRYWYEDHLGSLEGVRNIEKKGPWPGLPGSWPTWGTFWEANKPRS
jgi:hypothetical protein